MNNYDKFIGKLYDILLSSEIINYRDKAHDLREKRGRLEKYLVKLDRVQRRVMSRKEHIDILKKLYYDRCIIKRENIPESYFKSLEKRYLDEGQGHHNLVNPDNEIDRRIKEEHINVIIREQKDSLDTWLNYLLSSESDYLPMWAKVWALQGMLNIGNLNKEKDGYGRRGNTSVNPFVSFDSEILGKCVNLVKETFNNREVTDKEVEKIVSSGSFQKLYGKLLANKKKLKVVSDDGIWVKYNYETEDEANQKLRNGKEPEYLRLYNSLQGYNTGWCTAGSTETAKNQICGGSYQGGDFYVYYTKDNNGKYKIPRIAIRMDKYSIGEIRGIAEGQNIESNMETVLEEKLKEFPDGKSYQKKVHDMKILTIIYDNQDKRELTKEELAFIYEIDYEISDFGYRRDPRIDEIKDKRDKIKDLSNLLNCLPGQIGLTTEDLYREELIYYYGSIADKDYEYLRSKNLHLPRYVYGNINLSGLMAVKGLILPESIGGNLNLGNITTARGLTLPQNIGGILDLGNLKTAEDLILPQNIGGTLFLGSLTTAEGVIFPENIEGGLWLRNLKTTKSVIFPKNIEGSLSLESLMTAEGLTLPRIIGGDLFLSNLTTLRGLTLPESVGEIYYRDKYYTLEEIKELQKAGYTGKIKRKVNKK